MNKRSSIQAISYAYRLLWLATFQVFCPPPLSAQEMTNPWQIHGFVSQGYVWTSDNNFFGESTRGGSLDFTELGINGSWRINNQLHLAAQLLSRRAGKSSDGHIRLDYGMLDYRMHSEPEHDYGVRLGRFKNPLGLYNDTRDVAFTRPSIILPQSIYFDRTRDLALSSDGIQLYGDFRSEVGEWQLQLGVGQPQVDSLDTELSLLGANRPGTLQRATSYIGRLVYERNAGHWRLGLTSARLNMDYSPGFADPSRPGAISFTPVIVSGQYNTERFTFTAEYARRHLKYADSIVYAPPSLRHFTGESYYIQGSYRFKERWSALLRYDVTYLNVEDRKGTRYEALLGGTRPAYSQFAKDWTLGLRWDPHRNWMLRVEFHSIDGTAWLPLQDNPIPSATKRHWQLFSVLVSYRF